MASEKSFFVAFDNTLNCGGYNGGILIHSTIDQVDFQTGNIAVTASYGRRRLSKADQVACSKNRAAFLPKMQTYHLDFEYRGRNYRPVPSSAPIAKRFATIP